MCGKIHWSVTGRRRRLTQGFRWLVFLKFCGGCNESLFGNNWCAEDDCILHYQWSSPLRLPSHHQGPPERTSWSSERELSCPGESLGEAIVTMLFLVQLCSAALFGQGVERLGYCSWPAFHTWATVQEAIRRNAWPGEWMKKAIILV